MTTSGASIAARAAARSNATGPPRTRRRRGGRRSRSAAGRGSSTAGEPARAAASSAGSPAASRTARIGQPALPGGARDAAPVRVAAVGRGLDQARRDDRPGDRPGLGIVAGAADPAVMSVVAPSPSAACWRARSRATASIAAPSAPRPRGPGLDRRRPRRPGGEDEDRVVGARVAVDRELVPGPRGGRPEQAPQSVSGATVASVRTTDSIVAIRGWIIPTPLAMPLTVTADRPAVGVGQLDGRGRGLGHRVGRAQGRRPRPRSPSSVAARVGTERRRGPSRRDRAAAACR